MIPKLRKVRKLLPCLFCLFLFLRYGKWQGKGSEGELVNEEQRRALHLQPKKLSMNILDAGVPQIESEETSVIDYENNVSEPKNRHHDDPNENHIENILAPEKHDRHTYNPNRHWNHAVNENYMGKNMEYELQFSPTKSLVPTWTRITNDIYTYSAFWDTRVGLEPQGPLVRIVGLWRYQENVMQKAGFIPTKMVQDKSLNCSCLLWFDGQREPEQGALRAFVIEEALKTFVGTYFLCYPSAESLARASSNGNSVPYAVSLVPHSDVSDPHRMIYLSQVIPKNKNNSRSGAVCVRPLHGPFYEIKSMTQFLAYYHEVLGVTHFYFYDIATVPRIRELLERVSDGDVVVNVLPWNVPTSDWDELWDLGALAALNDCLYRTMGFHHHVAVVDLDEFIVPRSSAGSLNELYQQVLKHKHGNEGDAALILNAFFCREYKNTRENNNETWPIFQYMVRESRPSPPSVRSKMLVVPDAVVSLGHHIVHHFVQGTAKNRASPKMLSVLHHYRVCDGVRLGVHSTGSLVLDQETVTDRTILRYKKIILASRILMKYDEYRQQERYRGDWG